MKLVDFGIAKAATQIVETRAGMIKGKFSYLAPEQARSQDVDRRADVWSMGVVLWESMAGRSLFKGSNDLATLTESLTGTIPPLHEVVPEVPEAMSDIVSKSLSRDRDQRYQTALEMKQAIDEFLADHVGSISRSDLGYFLKDLFADAIAKRKRDLKACLSGSAVHGFSGEYSESTPSGPHSYMRERSSLTPVAMGAPTSTPTGYGSGTWVPGQQGPETQHGGGGGGRWAVIAALLGSVLLAIIVTFFLMRFFGLSADQGVATNIPAPADRDGIGQAAEGAVLAQTPSEGGQSGTAESPAASSVASEAVEATQGQGGTGTETANAPPSATKAPTEAASEADEPVVDEPRQTEGENRVSQADSRRWQGRRRNVIPRGRSNSVAQRSTSESEGEEGSGSSTEPPEPEQSPAPEPPAQPRVSTTSPSPASPPAQEEAGFLTLDTAPWSRVSLGGRVLGTTPLIRVRLPSGTHNLNLVNPESGISTVYPVTIRSGETTAMRLGL